MKRTIYRDEIDSGRWIPTSIVRSDGKEEFRELKKYGNRHAIFNPGSPVGVIHIDQYNATDFPVGTFNHATNYISEKTGIDKKVIDVGVAALVAGLVIYGASKSR